MYSYRLRFFIFFFSLSLPSYGKKVAWEESSYLIKNYTQTKKTRKNSNKTKTFKNLVIEFVGNVEAPDLGDKPLQAVDVDPDLSKNRLLASHSLFGEKKQGALQLIEIEPEIFLNSEILFLESDIHAIYQVESRVYFAGSDRNGAFYSYADILGDTFLSLGPKVHLPGYVATDIFYKNSKVVVTTGGNSGVHFFSEEMENPDWSYEIPHARSALYLPWSRQIKILSGEPATLHVLNFDGELIEETPLGHGNIPHSKSTLSYNSPFTYASVGNGGLKLICRNKIIEEIEPIALPGVPSELTVTNAASGFDNFFLTANGQAGIYLYEQILASEEEDICTAPAIQELGHMVFDGGTSANHVVAEDGYIFVAGGLGGIKILKHITEANQSH